MSLGAMGFSKSQLPTLCDGPSFCHRLAAKGRPGYVLNPASSLLSPRIFRTFLLSGSSIIKRTRLDHQNLPKRMERGPRSTLWSPSGLLIKRIGKRNEAPKKEEMLSRLQRQHCSRGVTVLLQRCRKQKLQVQIQNMLLV